MNNPLKLITSLEMNLDDAIMNNSIDINQTIIAGLNWPTNYWVEHAIKWIEQGATLNSEIYDLLIGISKDKNYSQSIRYKALKLSILQFHSIHSG